MTLEGYIKKTKGVKLAKSKALIINVRELEMDENGSYSAFVDDGKESFDVSINQSEQEEVIQTNCDCGDSDLPCVHILAVLQTLINNKDEKKLKGEKKPKKEKKAKPVKVSHVQAFTEKLSQEAMLLWLYAELEKDKKLFAIFKNHFEEKSRPLNFETVNEFMSNTITAVINKRKTVQTHEVASILEVWKSYVEKVLKAIGDDIYTEDNIKCIMAIEIQIINLDEKIAKSTSRIITFHKNFLQQVGTKISALDKENQRNFFKNYTEIYKKINNFHLFTFLQLVTFTEDREIGREIIKQLRNFKSLGLHGQPSNVWSNFIDWLINLDLMKESLQFLTIEKYNNPYNEALIRNAISCDEYKIAVNWCFDCMQSNYYEEYNHTYFELIEIVLDNIQNKETEFEIRKELSEIRTNYHDFLFFYSSAKSESQKEAVLEKYSGKYVKAQFYRAEIIKIKIKILLIQGRHDMAIKKIEDSDTLLDTLELWDELYKLDNELLLKKIIQIFNKESHYYILNKYFPVVEWLQERYEDDEIFTLLSPNKREYFRRN